jgi:hypothetical protein
VLIAALSLPKDIGLRSNMRPVAISVKMLIDHVIRRPNALSAALKTVERLNLR